MMPKRTKNVQQYKQKLPILTNFKVEEQIQSLYDNKVPLASGGYLVIDSTEALVSIDINSGRATSGRSVEETALHTNIEAAHEVARQLRLRDLSGLVVIDFIDMYGHRNRRAVEKAMKDACWSDKARIQISHISQFGLLEMSRQRLRSSFLETNTVLCEHCNGTGKVRAPETTALMILRAIEQAIHRGGFKEVHVNTKADIALYIMNYKRDELFTLEQRHRIRVLISADDKLEDDGFVVERKRKLSKGVKEPVPAIINPYNEYNDTTDDEDETEIIEEKNSSRGRKNFRNKNETQDAKPRNNNNDNKNKNKPSNKKDVSIVDKLLEGMKRIIE
jgi:ribonuclease E